MRKKSIYKILLYTAISVLLVFLLPVLGFDMKWQSFVIVILFVGLLYLFSCIYKIINKYFKKRKIIIAVIVILVICVFMFFLGISTIFLGLPFGGVTNVDKVKVVDSTWNSVVIDYTQYNHNDYKEITIKKPFFVNVSSGDTIEVRYPTNHPERMSYVLGMDTGLKVVSIGVVTFYIVIICSFIVVAIQTIKSTKGKRISYGKK